jgi:hypothetical protein
MGRIWHNAGAALAIVAGVLALAVTTWLAPGPQARAGDLTAVWATTTRAVGVLLILAPFFVDRWPAAVKSVLLLGGLALIGKGILYGLALGAGAALFDLVPGVAALAAAWLIGPRSRPEVARAERADELGRRRARARPAA